MKRIILSIVCLVAMGGLFSQASAQEGKVVYEEVMKLDIQIEGDGAQFADMLPKERKSSKVLLFNSDVSLYENNKDKESAEDIAMEHGGAMVMMKMAEPNNKFYINFDKQKTIEKKEFMTRNFLIEGTVEASGWKLTGEQKNLLEYPCQKAVKTDDEGKETIAWFTASIPVSAGPGSFIGLPGLVLAVEMNDGEHTIMAQSVEMMDIAKDKLAKPKGGKKVNQEEFDIIVAEKMKEMGAQEGEAGGTFIMKIER